MIYEEEIYPQDFNDKLEAFETIQKAFDADQVDSFTYQRAVEVIEKAKKDLSKLTKKKVFAKRKDGHIYLTTVYVNEQGEISDDLEAKFVPAPMGTPETMVGEYVKITKKNGEVLEGPIGYVHAWTDKNTGQPNAEIHVEIDGKLRKVNVGQIKTFEKFSQSGNVQNPQGNVDKNGYTILSQLGGSTGALLVEKDGVKYVKKSAANPEHLSSEMRSLKYMSQAGVPVPKVQEYIKGESVYLEYIEGKTLKEYAKSSNVTSENLISTYSKISKYFAAQALFANHDTIGLDYDNIMITPTGDPVFVDVGGSMGYRAQGGIKESWNNWNSSVGVSELKSMLDSSVNKQSASVFSPGLNKVKDLFEKISGEQTTIEEIIGFQLKEIKDKNPTWYQSPVTPDAEKLKARLDAAIKQYSPVEKKELTLEEKIEERNKNLSFDEKERLETLKSYYSSEKQTALKHGREDIAQFYDDFTEYMFMTDKEIQEANKTLYDPSSGYSGNDQEFIDSAPGITKAHLYSIRTHTDSSGYMNPIFRDLCSGLADGYNISFKEKNEVSFNKNYFESTLNAEGTNKKNYLNFCRLIVDAFSRMSRSKSKFYRKDITLYRGIGSDESSRITMGSKGDNIFCDSGVSSNGQTYEKAFSRPLVIATSMAEGIDVHTVGTHPTERETIMKPFNMQQVTTFKDALPITKDEDAKGRWQVRVEKPGLIPISFE
jgi:tRNA A-37 threonylcarbamoyl transferase component Bud32